MGILETLSAKGRELNLEFLVMGGHAVNAHGYERQTADLDLLVRRENREAWRALIISIGYSIFHEQETFSQFSPVRPNVWPVDLMFVNDETFNKMLAGSVAITMRGTAVRIPSVEHILALKLHALKNTHPGRELKDLLDVINLVEVNRIDLGSEKFRALCERYGNKRIYDKIVAASSR